MAEENKDLAPEAEDPEKKAAAGEAAPETKGPEPLPEIEDLRRQLDDARRQEREAREAAQAAQRQAQERGAEAMRFRSQAEEAQYAGLERALEGADARLSQLKGDLATAYQGADFARIADLQVEIGKVAARKTTLEDGRDAMKAQLTARQTAPVQQAPSDPVEALARTLTPRSAAWVRAHPEAASGATLRKLQAVAQYATNVRGIEPDSDAFFEHVEQEMGYRQTPAATSAAAQPQKQPSYNRRPGASLAPGRNAATPVNGKRAVTAADIPDSPAILEAAATSGITPAQYKEQYIRLAQDGTITDHLGVLH